MSLFLHEKIRFKLKNTNTTHFHGAYCMTSPSVKSRTRAGAP
jgi:hypothetical protein